MSLLPRLAKLEAAVANSGGDRPTVMQLELRAQRHLFDEAGGGLDWQVIDPGAAGPRRQAFDLAVQFNESEIWQQAERRGLTEALTQFLGRGRLSSEALAAAAEQWRHRFDPRPAADVAVAELRQFVIDAATAAGEPCPPWADRLDSLTAEEAIAADAWLQAHLPGEPVATPGEPDPTN